MKNEIILHQPNDRSDHIEVRIDNEKVTICLVPSRTSGTKQIMVPSRASGTKQIMVASRASGTININSILELL